MKTEKLDQKLRERGIAKLREKVRTAFETLDRSVNTNGYADKLRVVKAGKGENAPERVETVGIRQALAIIEAQIVENHSEYAAQTEVDHFVKEIDRLGQEVDDLRSDLDYHDHI